MLVGQSVDFGEFTGLNIRDDPGQIADSELVECQNFNLSLTRKLVKRTGFKDLGANLGVNSVTLLGYLQTDILNQIIAKVGTTLYYSTDGGVVWTVIAGGPHGNIEFGIQYTNKFYIFRKDSTILEWNGTTLTAITGSPTGSHAFIFRDRMFVVNTYAAGNLASRLYFSSIADFSATGWPATNFIDVSQGDGDVCIATTQIQDVLVIFKQRSSWLLYAEGDPADWTLRNHSLEVGCVSKYTIRTIEGYIYFVGPRAVYRTDGVTPVEISDSIHPVFEEQVLSISEANKAIAGWWEDKYIVIISLSNVNSIWDSLAGNTWDSLSTLLWNDLGGVYYRCFVFHLSVEGWTRWEFPSSVQLSNAIEITQPSNHRGLLFGTRTNDGKVYRFGDVIHQDAGSNYECRLKTKEFTVGSVVELKKGKWGVVEQSGAGGFSLTNIVNGIARTVQSISTTSPRLAYKVKGPQYFKTWQLSMTFSHANPVVLFGFSLILHVKNKFTRASA